jgi:peroxisomal 2,4-dienoyl-CoA reductase
MASSVSPSTESGSSTDTCPANKVVFCTGGAGTICSAQVRALIHLGANACIIGRNVEKTESAARDMATVRPGAKVIGIGAVDVRKFESLKDAAERCVKELGAIDFVMYDPHSRIPSTSTDYTSQRWCCGQLPRLD